MTKLELENSIKSFLKQNPSIQKNSVLILGAGEGYSQEIFESIGFKIITIVENDRSKHQALTKDNIIYLPIDFNYIYRAKNAEKFDVIFCYKAMKEDNIQEKFKATFKDLITTMSNLLVNSKLSMGIGYFIMRNDQSALLSDIKTILPKAESHPNQYDFNFTDLYFRN